MKIVGRVNDVYTREYGKAAYEAWLSREAEINSVMRDRRRCTVAQIVRLREDSFRMMKAGSRRHSLGLVDAKAEVFRKGVNARRLAA